MSDGTDWMRRTPGDVEPVDLRVDIPHSARMYDFWLGGKTNFPPDRALGEAFEQAIPSIKVMARENRRFLGRAVRHMAVESGIRQFLDIGTGIPTEGNTTRSPRPWPRTAEWCTSTTTRSSSPTPGP
jgi:hypothetical protein